MSHVIEQAAFAGDAVPGDGVPGNRVSGDEVASRAVPGDQVTTDKVAGDAPAKVVASPQQAKPVKGAPSQAVATQAVTRRVLIAEDEALIRLDLREMLIEEGFDVVGEAADGEKAVELAKDLRPDVVICDVKMPKMDGITAAGHIAGARIAPVVILTAFSQRDLIERARDAGAMAYLIKPFHKRDLLPAIEMATSRFAEIRALEAEVEGLQDRLEARKLIERAKGVLMAEHRLSEPEAFRWIQRAAMDKRTTMRVVAELVLTETGRR